MKNHIALLALMALATTSCINGNAKGEPKSSPVEASQPGTIETGQAGTGLPSSEQAAVIPGDKQVTSPAGDSAKVMGGGTTLLTKATFLTNVWNYEKSPQQWVFLGDKPAVIDFYADWCGPCKIASPILEEVSYEFAGKIDVYKIDTQREQELAAVFGVRSIPAFLYIPKSGKPTMMAGIARSKEDTKKMFVDNINSLLLTEKK